MIEFAIIIVANCWCHDANILGFAWADGDGLPVLFLIPFQKEAVSICYTQCPSKVIGYLCPVLGWQHSDVLLESLVQEPLPDGEGAVHQHLDFLGQFVLYILQDGSLRKIAIFFGILKRIKIRNQNSRRPQNDTDSGVQHILSTVPYLVNHQNTPTWLFKIK